MDWFQSKTGQLIALATIVTTLAGFGYTGATYVNRIANLEAKIGGLGETENEMKVIEERFASIETSVQFLDDVRKKVGGLGKYHILDSDNLLYLNSLWSPYLLF